VRAELDFRAHDEAARRARAERRPWLRHPRWTAPLIAIG
jgi:hypothetical protein